MSVPILGPDAMLELENRPAPEFRLSGSDGNEHSLADYRGKRLLVYFYPRDNTPGCTKEACAFRDMTAEYAALGVTVLGVSRDSLASHEKFGAAHRLPFVLLSDPDGVMMQRYGAWGEKVNYGKRTMGVIRSTVLIEKDGVVRKHWARVAKAEAHPSQVLEYLRRHAV